MNKHAWGAWATKISVAIICWSVLAIVFEKWWLALFAVLWLSDLKTTEQGRRDNDG